MTINNKIKKLIETEQFSFVISGVAAFMLGIFITLSFNSVRYNDFFPPEMKNISAAEVYKNINSDKGKFIFIDVRSEQEYTQAHAEGSVNLPIHYLYDDTHGKPNAKGVPLPKDRDTEIYLTCTGGRLAGVAYSYLEHYGYTNIKRLENGMSGWRMAGLPVISNGAKLESNPAPLDLPFNLDSDEN